MSLFDGLTFIILAATISAKRLQILTELIRKHGGKVRAINPHEWSRKSSIGADELVLADAKHVEDLYRVYGEEELADSHEFYSVDWISKSLEAQELLSKAIFRIKENGLSSVNTSSPTPSSKRKRSLSPSPIREDSLLDPSFINTTYECLRPTPLDHKNKALVEALSQIAHHRYLTGNSRSELSYNKAVAALKAYPRELKSYQEASQIQGIGAKITGMIKEFLASGRIGASEGLLDSAELKSLDAFAKIHGVGPVTASNWYHMGIETIDQLREAVEVDEIKLKDDQKIGLKYYDEFNSPMSRKLVSKILAQVQEVGRELFGERVIIEMTGGYRRGKLLNNDADILIHPREGSKDGLLDSLIAGLRRKGNVLEIISHSKDSHFEGKSRRTKSMPKKEGLDICLMAFQLDSSDPAHRVDLIVSSARCYAFAQLGWTGSRQFERAIRRYAEKERGISLSDHGMEGRGTEEISFENEEEIFAFLGVPYLPPHLRNC
jgi:DNA polymerase mu